MTFTLVNNDYYELCENIYIDNIKEVISRLEQYSGLKNIQIQDIKNFINSQPSTKFFFDNTMKRVEENDRKALYVWLDSGFQETHGHPLFISLLRDNYGEGFVGHYVGVSNFLKDTVITYFPKNRTKINNNVTNFNNKYPLKIKNRELPHLTEKYTEKNKKDSAEKEKDQNKPVQTEMFKKLQKAGVMDLPLKNPEDTMPQIQANINNVPLPVSENKQINNISDIATESIKEGEAGNITEKIFNQLLINNWKSVAGLDRYLKIIGCRILQITAKQQQQFYHMNNIQSVIINTGLLNNFGEDIYVQYRYHVKKNAYEIYKIMESKREYLTDGFSKEQASSSLNPIKFYEPSEAFEADLDSFDVNYRSLVHIIKERRDRFPEDLISVTDNKLADSIRNSLELGLMMQKRDNSYARPIYSTKTGRISWLMPLYINTELMEEPELVLVIRESDDFYEVKTILPYDDEIKDRITCLSLYGKIW